MTASTTDSTVAALLAFGKGILAADESFPTIEKRVKALNSPDRSANSRAYAVTGFQGLAPGIFDVEPALCISDRGEVSAEITVSADLYLTQRLVLQPRLEAQFSVQGTQSLAPAKAQTRPIWACVCVTNLLAKLRPTSASRGYGNTAKLRTLRDPKASGRRDRLCCRAAALVLMPAFDYEPEL